MGAPVLLINRRQTCRVCGKPAAARRSAPRHGRHDADLANHLRRCSTNSPTVNPASLMMASIRLRLSSLACRGTGTGLGSPSFHITVWRRPSRTTRSPALSRALTICRGDSAGNRSFIEYPQQANLGAKRPVGNVASKKKPSRRLWTRGSQSRLFSSRALYHTPATAFPEYSHLGANQIAPQG